MFRPSDLQLMLLHAAATRDDGRLQLPPDSIGGQAVRIRQSVTPLLTEGYLIEKEVREAALAWRYKNGRWVGLVVTDIGRMLVGRSPEPAALAEPAPAAAASKASLIAGLIRRPLGASLSDLKNATGWQPHSIRGAISTLKRQGLAVVANFDTGERRYHA